MRKLDQIIGEKITGLSLLTSTDDKNYHVWVDKILFTFNSNKMMIEIDKDLDELSLSFGSHLELNLDNKGESIIQVLEDSDSELKNCLNKRLIWLWQLTNNQGYNDGIQIDLSDHMISIRIQFIAEVSSINIYKVNGIK